MTMATTVPAAPRHTTRNAWPPLLHRVVRTIRSRGLLEKGQHVLVAVSGGPDSVALLSLLHRLRRSWRLTVTAVHCNYGLRGAESDGDQEFVQTLCRELEIPLYTRSLHVRDRVRRTSLQAAARELRYGAFMDVAKECGAQRIAVGHTADDQAETVLLWLLRGAGLTGLSGMPAFREGVIVRPLYECSRQDVLRYLRSSGLSYRQDSSNAKPAYLRNRIRNQVMPVLRQVTPAAVDVLCRAAELCREDDRCLDAQIESLCTDRVRADGRGGWVVERAVVRQLPPALQRRLVRALLQRCDPRQRAVGFRTVEQVRQTVIGKRPSRRLALRSARVTIERADVRFTPAGRQDVAEGTGAEPSVMSLPIPSEARWAGTGRLIRVQVLKREALRDVPLSRACIAVDADRVSGPLVVRSWRQGDRFYPAGMKGHSKKLQDFFTDLKVPVELRSRIPVVAAPEGIVWVAGYRQDERWAVSRATRRCLLLTVDGEGAR
jgi:tRNA(Ile)-lysidine synthase